MSDDNFYLDTRSRVDISTKGDLPHWNQYEKIQYITIRLADSLPQKDIRELKNSIEIFKKKNPLPWNQKVKEMCRKIIGTKQESLLNKGYGSCVLRSPELRNILKEAIFYKDGVDYDIIGYAIMPNHVHLLIIPRQDKDLRSIMHSIKLYTARHINGIINKKGEFWKRNYWDRIVRDEENFDHYISYIKHNPDNLEDGSYEVYFNNELIDKIKYGEQ